MSSRCVPEQKFPLVQNVAPFLHTIENYHVTDLTINTAHSVQPHIDLVEKQVLTTCTNLSRFEKIP